MESDETHKTGNEGTPTEDINSQCAVNSLILDYYKKFGRKRDLEQFFSLSTAQSDVRDTSGIFWRKMKSENDSSDSGDRKSDSLAQELCRISIRCSLPSSSQSDEPKTKTESPQTESPPIITEEAPADISRQTDDESFRSDDNHSQKSFDPLLDLSAHKPLSPTSSITSQRKLEWDSLADVGYGNESDRKTSGSSLSTLERLALKQQYSNNDSKHEIGLPTSHSTPLDENEVKTKIKKGPGRKMTKLTKRDVDVVEVNVPHTSESNLPQSINVNLTKHISFNVEKDGGVTIENIRKDVNVSPDKVVIEPGKISDFPKDKEIQTTLQKSKESSAHEEPKPFNINTQKIPVMISLNTLRKRLRKKKIRVARRRMRKRIKSNEAKEISPQEKSGEQLSEAESFEYMPGHIYNQNQMQADEATASGLDRNSNVGNKSSLESSCGITTDTSKGSKHSLTHDLEKCIEVLKATLQKRYNDGDVKKKLIKEIVKRLLSSKYRDDESSTDFLSGLTFDSQKLNFAEINSTTSTSDANNSDNSKHNRPQKSILRVDKFNSNILASSSQSAPNLFNVLSNEKLDTKVRKVSSNTESDESSKGKTSSDNALPKTSSEILYLKYLEALKREDSYKRHLRDKEVFMKQKLASSDIISKNPVHTRQEAKINSRLKDLMKDLVRNNYCDGSGDASKLEKGSSPARNMASCAVNKQRNHTVFTLEESQKKPNLKKKMLVERDLDASSSKKHYCCCPHHNINSKIGYADSSVQVNIKCLYENEGNEKEKEDYHFKCPNYHCSPRLHSAADNSSVEIKQQCKHCHNKLKHGQQASGVMCAKCGKYNDVDDCNEKCIMSPKDVAKVIPDKSTGDIKYICVCKRKSASTTKTGDVMIYRCSKLTNRGIQFEDPNEQCITVQCGESCKCSEPSNSDQEIPGSSGKTSKFRRYSQCSQTDLIIKMIGDSGHDKNKENVHTWEKGQPFDPSVKAKKTVMINEATRSIQTEISLNPKILEPTLSDIVVIDSCVKLICEQTRSKVMSTDDSEPKKTYSDRFTVSDMGTFLLSPNDSEFKEKICNSNKLYPVDMQKGAPASVLIDCQLSPQSNNMSLMLKVDDNKIVNKAVNQVCEASRVETVEQGTSMGEDLDNSSQRHLKFNYDKTSPSSDNQSSYKGSSSRGSQRKSCLAKPHSARSPVRNTYPKVQLREKDKNLYRRANTDTGRLETIVNMQTEPLIKIFPEPLPEMKSATYENSSQTHDNSAQKFIFQHGQAPPHSPRKHPKIKQQVSKHICHTKERPLDMNKITSPRKKGVTSPRNNSPASSRKKSKPLTTETFSQTINTSDHRTSSEDENVKREIGIQKDLSYNDTDKKEVSPEMISKGVGNEVVIDKVANGVSCQTDEIEKQRGDKKDEEKCKSQESSNGNYSNDEYKVGKESADESILKKIRPIDQDPIINMIQDIKRRYSKTDLIKIKKKKCFTEIISVLNYLLETEDSTDQEHKSLENSQESSDNSGKKTPVVNSPSSDKNGSKYKWKSSKSPNRFDKNAESSSSPLRSDSNKNKIKSKSSSSDKSNKFLKRAESESLPSKHDKGVQMSSKSISKCTESSDQPCSTDIPTTTDSAACRIFSKIKRECEKYHFRRSKCGRKCEVSSSTSINCENCKKVHHCFCRQKCRRPKIFDKIQRNCLAYNLILQTSESVISEDNVEKKRPLRNVVIKVPKNKSKFNKETCKHTVYKIEELRNSPIGRRSRSCPKESEMSSNEDYVAKIQHCTVREYLEKNRPDFVEKCSERQNCLKFINEMRASERAAHRNLLSLQVDREPDLTNLSTEQLRQLAQQIGLDLRRKKPAPKFISEREMKKHSENIYKTLPEVVQKKEESKKENIKKTNLLMANIFKKNLQKKTLKGNVNLSNYSTVIKI